MSDQIIIQALLAWENQLSGSGFGDKSQLNAQKRGWLDADGRLTDDGRTVFEALATQMGQRSVFRNLI